MLIDSISLPVAIWMAFCLRLDTFYVPDSGASVLAMCLTVACSLLAFTKFGLYRAVIRYMSNHAMKAVAAGVSVSACVLALSAFALQAEMPRSVPLIYWCLALVFVGGSRMTARSLVHTSMVRSKERIVIYGAGKSGLQLSSVLFHSKAMQPVAFIDDDQNLHGTDLNGIRVHSPAGLPKVLAKYGATKVLLALGHAPRSRRSLVIRFLEQYPVVVQTIPAINDVVSGKAKIEEVRDVDIEDLLGRDEVSPDRQLLAECISKKTVMVTGAGGSIGSELCRQIVRLAPLKLILVESSEYALYEIERELKRYMLKKDLNIELHAVVGSVQKQRRMAQVMRSFGVETVYHAAAYKHVPLVEQNVIEGIRNNVFGTWHAAEAAIEANVETFVLISTDKAVRPTNVMGASKRLAELVLQGLSKRQAGTRFCMVRFGNVLGSSGSVVPLFRDQIKQGGPVTVTHPDITRYFMTIPEAAQLVLQAGAMGEGGDVFLLDMGQSVKINDLAVKLIHLMGLELKDQSNPDGDIAIEYSGLRPGEKLYEELLIGNEPMPTAHPRIMRGREISLAWDDVKVLLDRIDMLCKDFDCEAVREVLMMAPLDYKPSDSLSDLVWNKTYTDMPGTSMQDRMRDLQMPANEVDTNSNISNG
ncbi:nucleoside-diphosphate sugar epimerase/dehydratase [Oleiphilus sp. HI0125]|uniref:polysaccharide biosynthesis protein n=1 Tax=Oleiphilus sp. HI0125 TaxID=1822266 RepID=UPI001E64871A|nr:nucleoside-diphosphate sugar epimerase/dehydratase [Oleiphilus sp. HI0125]